MAQDLNNISQMRAITISREYGSGGGEVAQRLAKRLQWQLVDHEIVVRVAQELGVSVEEAEERDEYAEGVASRILSSLQAIQPTIFAVAPLPVMVNAPNYQEALKRVVEGSIASEHVVIVGRGSQVLLGQHRDVLHVRIVAPLEQRIAYVMRRENINRDDARTRIQIKDQDRMRYLQTAYHQNSEDAVLYDITVNTAVLSLNQIVDLIALVLQEKATRLSLPTEELGPGAGLERYPSRPGDFRPPANLNDAAHNS
ncbi:MAG: cytidylate kinase-like family protein [Ktedonobacteraceae bacterium]|nr:cytidylate kinase-like family protein [Ktedonobacteraceae bacterium]